MSKSYPWLEKSVRCAVVPVVFLIALAGMGISSYAQNAVDPFAAKMLSPGAVVNPDGTIAADRGLNGTVDLRGWDVTLASRRGPVLTPRRRAPTWSALANNGLNGLGDVRALAVIGTDLYVAGGFAQTADGAVTNLNNIAKYSGGVWSALTNNGLNRPVLALAVSGTDLYVGGQFTQTADGTVTNLNNIAKYSTGTSSWSALANNGLNDFVGALAVSGTDLYVGGGFAQTGDGSVTNLKYIAEYSGGVWSALPNNGLNSYVSTLATDGTDLYVGGDFGQTADGIVTNLHHIARLYDCTAASIVTHPQSQTIGLGGQATLSVIATGSAPLHCLWYRGASGNTSTPVGTDSSSFTTPALSADTQYWVRVTNACGYADSTTATITLQAGCVAPTITTQPSSQTVSSGSTATMTVIATGDTPIHYQWYRGASEDTSTPVGTDSNTYTTTALTTTTSYWAYAYNACGHDDSQTAIVTVTGSGGGPTITSVTSKKATAGSLATIRGTGFSATAKNNTVKFGAYAATIKKARTGTLTVTIPKKCRHRKTYNVTVTVGGKTSNAWPFTVK